MTESMRRLGVGRLRLPIERARLANGMRIVVQSDAGWPLIASTICYDAGSRYDPRPLSGLAHICEHLAFDGPRAAQRETFPARIESTGGSAQARTMTDRLCFSATFPRRALDAVLAVEAERMARPLVPQDEAALDIQRRVVLEELRERSQSRLRATAFEHIHRCLYPDAHPYHTPPAGEPSGVAAVTTRDVAAFAASYFSPANAVIALVGDVSIGEALERLQRAFGPLPAQPQRNPEAAVSPLPRHTGAVQVPAAVSAPCAHLAWSVPGMGDEGWYVAAMLMRSLTTGRSSPLAHALVDRAGLAREVRGSLVTMRDCSTLVLSATAARGVGAQHLEQSLVEAVDTLLAAGVSSASLARAGRKALSDYYVAVDSFEGRAELCASLTCYLDAPERLESEPCRFLSADRDAIAAFASELRCPSARALVSLVPSMEAAA